MNSEQKILHADLKGQKVILYDVTVKGQLFQWWKMLSTGLISIQSWDLNQQVDKSIWYFPYRCVYAYLLISLTLNLFIHVAYCFLSNE